ncbi:MAG TPA: TMEM165/GDT1 family protein [Acidimicrobiales bacterium]
MEFAVVIAVFPIIFLGELPDKTMFASLVLSTRGRPIVVWVGAALAFVVHVVIAVTVGAALFHLLPHRVLEAFVAAMFFAGSALAIWEARKVGDDRGALIQKEITTHRRTLVTAFVVIFIAEWGDLTQILTANLAAHYRSALSVAVGAVLALWAVAALAVAGGQSILRVVDIRKVRIVTAVVLAAIGGWAVWEAVR